MDRLRDWLYWQRHGNGGPRERIGRAIAWVLPRQIAYWAAIRVMAHATMVGKGRTQTPAEVTIPEVLVRWHQR